MTTFTDYVHAHQSKLRRRRLLRDSIDAAIVLAVFATVMIVGELIR